MDLVIKCFRKKVSIPKLKNLSTAMRGCCYVAIVGFTLVVFIHILVRTTQYTHKLVGLLRMFSQYGG